ncbi:MAG TPA: AI-2E family transporter [Thermoanaerobaculia bacterium]|nr:AI-2E family transporter [Thermoanaerobaculia bacterium]
MSKIRSAHLYPVVFLLVLLVAVGGLSYVVLRPFLSGILWASVVAVALWPLWTKVRARAGNRQGLAAGLFSLAAALVVLLPAVLLGAAILNQAAGAATAVAARLKASDIRSWNDVLAIPGVDRAMDWARDTLGLSPNELQDRGLEIAKNASSVLASAGGAAVLSFLDILITFILTLFLLFFFLRDGEDMVEALTDLIPIDDTERRRIVRSLGGMLESIFKGSLLCAIIQGTSGALAWLVAGLPSAILAGVAMSILSLLPVGGTAIVWGPALVLLFAKGRTGMAIAFLLWNVLVTSTLADNVLKPLLIGKKGSELSTLLVFLGVFGGLTAFGLLGVFVGPMSLAVGVMLLRILREMARASRGASAEA